MKKGKAVAEPVSLGTRLAEKTRAIANQLSAEERERLLQRGLQLARHGAVRTTKPRRSTPKARHNFFESLRALGPISLKGR